MRKTGLILIKLSIVVGLLAGVYQLMDVFRRVVSPDPAVEVASLSASVGFKDVNRESTEDAKSFFDKQQKIKQSEASKKQENSKRTAMQAQRGSADHNLAIYSEALSHSSGNQLKNQKIGTNIPTIKPSQVSQAVNAKSDATQVPASQSSTKSPQRVGGSPGEPLVAGSLPFGNGLVFLLVLSIGYAIRVFYIK